MATAPTASTPLTGNQAIDGVIDGTHFNAENLTFSFPTDPDQYGDNYSPTNEPNHGFEAFDADMQAAYIRIMGHISEFADVTFTQDTGGEGVLRAGVTNTNRVSSEGGATSGWAYRPDYGRAEPRGDIWFDPADASGIYYDPDYGDRAYTVYMHEIGHSLGLQHTDGADGVGSTFDNHNYTLMSANRLGDDTQTYMQLDIRALQQAYGANFNHNSGNTTYTWSPTTGERFENGVGNGAPTQNTLAQTIWDGNGIDTYDLSNYSSNITANLNPGEWVQLNNSQHMATGDVASKGEIANALLYNVDTRSLIENVKGGSGNDTLIGNQANNTFTGNAGADTMTGGAGSDTFVARKETTSDLVTDATSADRFDVTAWGLTSTSQLGITLSGGQYVVTGNDSDEHFNSTNAITASQFIGITGSTPPDPNPEPGATFSTANFTGTSAAENIVGNTQNNVIDGAGGSDTINGGSGDDTILGGTGTDLMTGGAGADRFKFNTSAHSRTSEGWDTIQDFVQGTDKIDLSSFDANNNVSGTQSFTFLGAFAPFTGPGQVRYQYVSNVDETHVTGNVDSDGSAEFTIKMKGNYALTQNDFAFTTGTPPTPTVPTLSIGDVTVAEDAGTASFTVSLSAASSSAVTVNYATSNGSATSPADYTAASGALTFSAGQTSKTVTVNIVNDTVEEPAQTFNVTLSAPSGATIADGTGVGTISANDAPNPDPSGDFATPTFSGTEYYGLTTDEVIVGNESSDTIDAYLGNDVIRGAGGGDWIWGGEGIDTFVFLEGDSTANVAADGYVDWTDGEKFDISRLDQTFTTWVGASALTADGQLGATFDGTYTIVTGRTADTADDFQFLIQGDQRASLSLSDFIL